MELSLSQQLAVAGLVVGCLLLAAKTVKGRGWTGLTRLTGSSSLRSLERLDRYVLTPQHQLHLVRIEDRLLVIATHPQGVEVVESRSQSACGGRS